MSEYGITDKGFVIKRLDTILEEIHSDLTDGFGTDTRLVGTSFLNTLATTFAGQIADLWETAQDSYYAKYPATATGISLDNAVQFGGIKRAPARRSVYPIHCTGDDGTVVYEDTYISTETTPEIRLFSAESFTITRENFNEEQISVAVAATGVYIVNINGKAYTYASQGDDINALLAGLKKSIIPDGYEVTVVEDYIEIKDKLKTRSNTLVLTDNLTTRKVTTVANFFTEDYGKITLPNGIVTKIVNNVAGFDKVTNLAEPVYGRAKETDVELRQSYIAKSALRSNTMIDSITAELLNNVRNVESASGFENVTDITDSRGLPPHSIEIIVEGGNSDEIASAILKRKAGGIQTYGEIEVIVPSKYGDNIPIRFNRPEYLYTYINIVLHVDKDNISGNYRLVTTESILEYGRMLKAGDDLMIQPLSNSIYNNVSGIEMIDIKVAYSAAENVVPSENEYKYSNIKTDTRHKILISKSRISIKAVYFDGSKEVELDEHI